MTKTEKKLQKAIDISGIKNLHVNGYPKNYSIKNTDISLRCFNGNTERRRTTLTFACAISDYSIDEIVKLIKQKWGN